MWEAVSVVVMFILVYAVYVDMKADVNLLKKRIEELEQINKDDGK